MLRGLFIFILLTFSALAFSQRTEKVTATYTYYPPENVTLEEAKRIALDRAKISAIADAFGTLVTQSNSTVVSNQNGQTDSRFLSWGGSEVKGEWIETTKEPIYNIRYEEGMLVVSVEVKGVVREIVSAGIDFTAKILRNGTEERFESNEFRSGDDMYLYFKSPVDGFLAIYLMDDYNNVFCLLPYRNQSDGVYKVKANKRYLLFCTDAAPIEERSIIDEYVMTCNNSPESNHIYILFSTNPFVKAIDSESSETLPRELTGKDFHKWLAKVRRKDNSLVLLIKQISISK